MCGIVLELRQAAVLQVALILSQPRKDLIEYDRYLYEVGLSLECLRPAVNCQKLTDQVQDLMVLKDRQVRRGLQILPRIARGNHFQPKTKMPEPYFRLKVCSGVREDLQK